MLLFALSFATLEHTSELAITVHQCTPEDAGVLSALAQRTFYETFTGTCTEADMQHFLENYYNIERIREELGDSTNPVFFAEVDNEPVGYIRFGENAVTFPYDGSGKALEISRLYVDAGFHKKGIAQRLMKLYLDYAKDNGYSYLWLGVWEYNYRAQKFYSKYGFTFTGYTHPFPIGDTPQTDEWWAMVK